MGLFDRFRSQWEQRKKKERAPKHVVSSKEKAEEAKRASFRAVSAARPAVKGKPAETKRKPARENTGSAYRTLLKPVVTEKTTRLAGEHKYVFVVAPRANKIAVRQAVRSLYGVEPVKVNVMNFEGKKVRYGRTSGVTRAWRKAIVTLAAGQKIDVLEG